MSSQVFISDEVRRVIGLYRDILSHFPIGGRVQDFLGALADRLWEAHDDGDVAACVQIGNWFPNLVGADEEAIFAASFSREDARLTIAREHGFSDWGKVRSETGSFDPDFERAVGAVVLGSEARLMELLEKNPGLIHQRSSFGHGATLLLYLAANGVETYRQKVPYNAPAILSRLLAAGADRGATASVYGGHHGFRALLESSRHPAEAGVTDQLLYIFVKG